MTTDYSYFDEVYFQDGAQRGTAYHRYLENARRSKTYEELAESIHVVFQPRRSLEIGCATGVVVRRLNEIGTEAHGIDVSSWAVENREHPNVLLAGAVSLPFPDGYFDLVYSVHALEHVPTHILGKALSEIDRVCKSGIQFHLMPIVGDGPYVGERSLVEQKLRKDPTHNNLLDRSEWTNLFGEFGWKDSGQRIAIFADTEICELSTCQFILTKTSLSIELLGRLSDRNFTRCQLTRSEKREAKGQIQLPVSNSEEACVAPLRTLTFGEEATWKDLECQFPTPKNFLGGKVGIVSWNANGKSVSLRIALVAETTGGLPGPNVPERWLEVKFGWTTFDFPLSELSFHQGDPDLTLVVRCLLGGSAKLASLDA